MNFQTLNVARALIIESVGNDHFLAILTQLITCLSCGLEESLKKDDSLIRPSRGLEEFLKNIDPLIRLSGGLEDSLKKFDPLIHPVGGLEESLN